MSGLRLSGRVVIATHNPGKKREIASLLVPFGLDFVSAGELGLPEPEETETSFAGNAQLKALAAAQAAGLPALADDSGFCVAALNGEPGIFSARWARAGKDFGVAMHRVLDGIGTGLDRRAWFICALCLAWPDGHTMTYQGRVDGTVAEAPRGSEGFGYDPIFVPFGEHRTYAEMGPEEKERDSHRARAFAQFRAALL